MLNDLCILRRGKSFASLPNGSSSSIATSLRHTKMKEVKKDMKDIVDQVDAPDECGMSFDDFQGMEPEDRVEAYAARDVSIDGHEYEYE